MVCWWRLAEGSLSLVEAVRDRGLPAVGVVGDGWMWEGVERDPWQPFRPTALDLGDAGPWIFNSRWLRRRAAAAGLRLERTTVVSPGVDLARFHPGEADEGGAVHGDATSGAAGRGGPVSGTATALPRPWSGRLLYAGRLSPSKGVDTAVRALSLLEDAVLTVVGDGHAGYARELGRIAAGAGAGGRLRIRPAVEQAALADLYRQADNLLFPVRWEEPLGLVPLEAMACGTPVIATGTGGSAEYLRDGRNCLLCAPDDPRGLAEAVARLAGDADLRATLSAAGTATAGTHDAQLGHRALEALLLREVDLAARQTA